MALTKANIASRVLRDLQIPEDTSTSSVQALSDVKQMIDEIAREVWALRLWPEYILLGTYSLPANTQKIPLSSIVVDSGFSTSGNGKLASFYEIAAIREGSIPLSPEDPGAVQRVQPDLWASTTTPVKFMNLGQAGLFLGGYYSTATTLSFFGKADFQALTDTETWILNNEDCLRYGATAKMLRVHERDFTRAGQYDQMWNAEVAKLINSRESQGANLKRVTPLNPWTSYGTVSSFTTSPTGAINPY